MSRDELPLPLGVWKLLAEAQGHLESRCWPAMVSKHLQLWEPTRGKKKKNPAQTSGKVGRWKTRATCDSALGEPKLCFPKSSSWDRPQTQNLVFKFTCDLISSFYSRNTTDRSVRTWFCSTGLMEMHKVRERSEGG